MKQLLFLLAFFSLQASTLRAQFVTIKNGIETINAKISAANEYISQFQTGFTLMSYLDLQSRMNSPFKDYCLSYSDEVEPDGSENYDANPVEVSADGDGYTLNIVTRVREGQRTYCPEDWHYWCAMLSIYDACLICLKKESEWTK